MRFQIGTTFGVYRGSMMRRFLLNPWGNGYLFGLLTGLVSAIALYWLGYLVGYLFWR